MIPLRSVIKEYIGGGWGKDAPDEQHVVPSYVVRGTDFESVQSGIASGVPYRWHKASNVRSRTLRPGDIVFEVSGGSKNQPVGRSLLVDASRLNLFQADVIPASFCKKIRPDSDRIHPRFLLAHLQLAWIDRRIVQWQVQSTGLSNFNFEAFLDEFSIELPPLSVQKRLAGIFSAYDTLIENSQRRIQILEEMSQGLFREWFVHYRFPGHESVRRVESPVGAIPEGWQVRKLSEVADVNRAQISARTAPERLHYIDISSVSPGRIDGTTTFSFADAPGRARRVVQHGDVLWSCVRPNRRSHAQLIHPDPGTIASTGFAVLTPKTVPFTFLYFATTTDDFVAYLTNNATGAAYPAVTGSTFEKADVIVPSQHMLTKFGESTIPIAEGIHVLRRQIQNLERTRDLLLPRLITGEVDVEAIP
jgi:type I restriction enzyme S subunit